MGYTPHVLVAGGGIVGTAIARDLAIRGLDVTLVERGTLTSGVTGRDGGLLESGARFAHSDPQTAKRCAVEQERLTDIASHYVTETGGLIVEQADDDAGTLAELQEACKKRSIPTTELSAEELQEREAALSNNIERALQVPDMTVDPQLLTVATARDAQQYGADIRTHTELTAIHVRDGALDRVELAVTSTVTGRPARDITSEDEDEQSADNESAEESEKEADEDGDREGESNSHGGSEGPVPDGGREHLISHKGKTLPGSGGASESSEAENSQPAQKTEELSVDYLVNATGAWAARVAELADLSIPLETMDDTRVVLAEQVVDQPVSPSTAVEETQVVPTEEGCLVTCQSSVPDSTSKSEAENSSEPDTDGELSDLVTPESVDTVLETVESLVPTVATATPAHSARGRRYAVAGHGRPRNVHDFVRIDHGKQHDCWGLMTALGGSMTTHRLLAERVADAVCGVFGISRPCQTADLPLPGCDPESAESESRPTLPDPVVEASARRLGSRTREVLSGKGVNPILCAETGLTRVETHDTVTDSDQLHLLDVCVRTGCEPGFWTTGGCLDALTAERYPRSDPELVDGILVDVLEHYWPEKRAVAYDRRLSTMAQTQQVQAGWLNRRQPTELESVDAFDTGIEKQHGEDSPGSARNMGRWTDNVNLSTGELSFDFRGDTR